MRTLIGSLLLVALTAIVGLGWTLDRFFDRFASDKVSDEVRVYQEMGSKLAAILDTTTAPEQVLPDNADKQFLSVSIQAKEDFPLPEPMKTEFESGKALVLESDDGVTLHYFLPRHSEVLTVMPNHYNSSSLSSVRLLFTITFYCGVLVLLLLWLYPLIKRLATLRTAAKEFGSGRLDSRISTQGVSYISDIEVEFNRMAERIQTLISDNKLLSSAVSHDLRTPLARLRFGIDTLEDTRNPQAQKKYMQRLSADISEMEKLVSSLLDFARLDHALLDKNTEILDLEKLISQCIELHQNDQILISHDVQSDQLLRGHANYFSMMLGNLLQNALRFARLSVNVGLIRSQDNILLSVSDDGPGIPESEYRNVLMPFTRGDGTGTEKGYGLGLAIVNRIAQLHGGSVTIDKSPELRGARISVLFPATQSIESILPFHPESG